MQIIKMNIDEVTPYENNAKLHPQEQIEQIKKSILEFGNNDPIAIDENNIIIEGHGRYEALKQLDYKEIECIKLSHLSEEQYEICMNCIDYIQNNDLINHTFNNANKKSNSLFEVVYQWAEQNKLL